MPFDLLGLKRCKKCEYIRIYVCQFKQKEGKMGERSKGGKEEGRKERKEAEKKKMKIQQGK